MLPIPKYIPHHIDIGQHQIVLNADRQYKIVGIKSLSCKALYHGTRHKILKVSVMSANTFQRYRTPKSF